MNDQILWIKEGFFFIFNSKESIIFSGLRRDFFILISKELLSCAELKCSMGEYRLLNKVEHFFHSFYVGSAVIQPQVYDTAIKTAKTLFDTDIQLGMPEMNMLNISGGFSVGI